jgi:hypothetical protein
MSKMTVGGNQTQSTTAAVPNALASALSEVKPLTDITVSLETIQPGKLPNRNSEVKSIMD